MKSSSYRTMGYILGAVVVIPTLLWLINSVFFKGNEVSDETVQQYINDSKQVEIFLPDTNEMECNWETYYTEIKQNNNRTSKTYEYCLFYSEEYQKYILFITFDGFDIQKTGRDRNEFRRYYFGHFINASVNKKLWDDNNYGTKENPLPLFAKNIILGFPNTKDLRALKEASEAFDISDEMNYIYVKQYLNYFFPKEELLRLYPNFNER